MHEPLSGMTRGVQTSDTESDTEKEKEMNRITTIAALSGMMMFPTLALADIDVLPRISNGRIVTYAYDKDDAEVLGRSRVFGAELGEFPFPAGETEEPGFYTDAVVGNLPAGAGIGYRILGGLRIWDEVLGNFDTLASVTMDLETSGGTQIRTTPNDLTTIVDGPIFGVVSGSLFMDAHPDYVLSDASAEGIYLLTISVWTDLSGINDSKPLFLVFGNEANEAQFDAAIAYAQNVLVPSPGAAALFAAAIPFAMRRRR